MTSPAWVLGSYSGIALIKSLRRFICSCGDKRQILAGEEPGSCLASSLPKEQIVIKVITLRRTLVSAEAAVIFHGQFHFAGDPIR